MKERKYFKMYSLGVKSIVFQNVYKYICRYAKFKRSYNLLLIIPLCYGILKLRNTNFNFAMALHILILSMGFD
jgi:hypothetical protein